MKTKKKLLLFALVLLMFTVFAPKMVQAAAQTTSQTACMAQAKVKNRKISYSWTKVAGAVKYKVYQTTCGKLNFKCIKVTKGTSYTTKHLRAGVAYKACVIAYDKNGKKIVTSPCIHARTKGKKKLKDSNATKVTAAAGLALTVKQTGNVNAVIAAKDGKKPVMVDNHAPEMRYYTTDKTVASVSKSGLVTAKAVGTATIYSVAPTGVYAKTVVTVTAEAAQTPAPAVTPATPDTPVADTSKEVTFSRTYSYFVEDGEKTETVSYPKTVKAADFNELIASETEGKGTLSTTPEMAVKITYGFMTGDNISVGCLDGDSVTDTPIYYEFVDVNTVIKDAPVYLQEGGSWYCPLDGYSYGTKEFKEKYGDCVALRFYINTPGDMRMPVYPINYSGREQGCLLINKETNKPVTKVDEITSGMKLELINISASEPE